MKTVLCCTCGLLLAAANLQATPLFSDSFSYPDGPLLGQGGWTITGTSVVNPIQVASGAVVLTTTGQDAYSALPGGPITLADGSSLYMGLDINVTSVANTSGDYFLHWSVTAGNTSTFPDRLYVKDSGTGGFLLGWAGSSGANVYGTTVLSYGTSYRVVTAYNVFNGAANDTGAIYETLTTSPFDPVLANNTAYLTSGWIAGSEASPETIAEVNLRQGTSGPLLTLDNLDASQTWSEAAAFTAIPEPGCLSLLGGFGLLAWHFIRRRK